MATRKFLTHCALVAITASVSTASAAPTLTFAVADGSVRDGLAAPKDDAPDDIIENSVAQILDIPTFEDRGIIEFNLAGLDLPVSHARLSLPAFASMGPFPFDIEVFAYPADGQLTLSDWTGGTFLRSFRYRGKEVVRLDVTSAVEAALAAGQQFIGFRFEFAEPSPIAQNGPFLAFHTVELPPPATLRINQRNAGGSMSSVVPEGVICRNLTTGQSVTINANAGDARDCAAAGLDLRRGDLIIQTLPESAQ
ncbi:hypothetical protein [Steroidobacter cummioxidans]|uniref:hypothetical protein n=1 Tax=Steroidobacter cummioxidans TaxID=1803913 RepID=UPI00128FDA78|nr:hypothetical protein [Steroidobacter cummioxidans]